MPDPIPLVDPVPLTKLRTGVEIPTPFVATVYMIVRSWFDDGVKGALLFYDAVSLARDPSYKLFGTNGDALREAGFIDEVDGSLHPVRD